MTSLKDKSMSKWLDLVAKPTISPIYYKGRVIGRIEKITFKDCQFLGTIRLTHCYKCGVKVQHCPGIGLICPNMKCDVVDGVGRFNLKEA